MRDISTRLEGALLGVLIFGALAFQPGVARAQDATFLGDLSGPTVDEYLKEAGPDAKLVGQGELKIDGKTVNCGKRPTVLNSNFDSWGGAFPGFVILNTKKITGLSTPVKLYIYSHECGHQFEGPDETKADLFAIRRGVKWGWLDAVGMEDICTFISTLKGDSCIRRARSAARPCATTTSSSSRAATRSRRARRPRHRRAPSPRPWPWRRNSLDA